jgi:hypothetical protein
MQNTLAKALLLTLPLALAGCWETEQDCYMRLLLKEDPMLTPTQALSVAAQLIQIKNNTDLNVCDYTVLGGRVVKID